MDAKTELRNKVKSKRATITRDEMNYYSKCITDRFLASDIYKNAKSICVYVPLKEEIDTVPIITRILDDEKVLTVPVMRPEKMMDAAIMTDFPGNLARNNVGIMEPVEYEALDPDKIDVIITPGLCYSKTCKRLGYGGGYYDRFLTRVSDDCIKVGLSLSIFVFDDVPTGEYDMDLDYVITEDEIINAE